MGINESYTSDQLYTNVHSGKSGKELTVNHTAALVMDDIAKRCTDDTQRNLQ
jgi:hypothetical protein